MKRRLLVLVLLGVPALALAAVAWRAPRRDYKAPTLAEIAAHVPAPSALVGELPPGAVVRALDVEGMCCSGCTGKLYNALRAVPGVSQAAVRFEDGVAEVVVPEGLDVAELVAALSFDKYRAVPRP